MYDMPVSFVTVSMSQEINLLTVVVVGLNTVNYYIAYFSHMT